MDGSEGIRVTEELNLLHARNNHYAAMVQFLQDELSATQLARANDHAVIQGLQEALKEKTAEIGNLREALENLQVSAD